MHKETPQEEFELGAVLSAQEPEQLVKLGMVTESPKGARYHHMVPRNCEHQRDTPLPCAWPSCPQGHASKSLVLTILRPNGMKVRARFRRRLRNERFEWTQDAAS